MRIRRVILLCIIISITLISVPWHTALSKDRVVYCVTEEWEPYMGSKLKNKGFLAELVKEIFHRVGYQTKTEFFPWARAVYMVKKGNADILLGAYYTQERSEFLEYTQAVGVVETVLFTRKGRQITYDQLADLKDYRIGIVREAAHGKEFDEADYLRKQKDVNIEENIKKLIEERIDIMVGPKDVTLFLIRNKYPQYVDQIEIIGRPLNVNKIYIAFSKKVPAYSKRVDAFTKGLKMIKEDGAFDRIAQKHGIAK